MKQVAEKKDRIVPLEQNFEITEKLLDDYLATTGSPLTPFQRSSFKQLCFALKLNPITREIYAVTYRDKEDRGKTNMSILIGYEVYLKRAERTGLCDGYETGIKFEKHHPDSKKDDMVAWIKIYRKDRKHPIYHEVFFIEYAQYVKRGNDWVLNTFWKNKPRTMLTKVVLAQGFRIAFPEHCGGLPYTAEEIKLEATEYEILNDKEKEPLFGKKEEDAGEPEPKPDPKEDKSGVAMEEMDTRAAELIELGFKQQGQSFSKGEKVLTVREITEVTAEDWKKFLEEFKTPESDPIKSEIPKQSNNDKATQMRIRVLETLKMQKHGELYIYEGIQVTMQQVRELGDEQWQNLIRDITPRITAKRKELTAKNNAPTQEEEKAPTDEKTELKNNRSLLEEWAKSEPEINEYFQKLFWIKGDQTVVDFTDSQVNRFLNNEQVIVDNFKKFKQKKATK